MDALKQTIMEGEILWLNKLAEIESRDANKQAEKEVAAIMEQIKKDDEFNAFLDMAFPGVCGAPYKPETTKLNISIDDEIGGIPCWLLG